MTTGLDSPPPTRPSHKVKVTGWGWARWFWRQLTSMRTALLLLFLLAVAALPGSWFPQRGVNPIRVLMYYQDNPTLAGWLDRFSMFDVYAAPWFAAIYLLLMGSLIGCVLPRVGHHARAVAAPPPRAPRFLARMPVYTTRHVGDASSTLDRGADALRTAGFRVVRGDDDSVSAEKGYLSESGNLIFHGSLVLLLVGFAFGGLWGYRGTVIVVEGEGFSNTLPQYDDFRGGRVFDGEQLAPFSLTLNAFDATFIDDGPRIGQADDFQAQVSYQTSPGAPVEQATFGVNEPLDVDGANVFLLGHGYAPEFTVRDGRGTLMYSGPVTTLPQDAALTSVGVVKVPDASPEQLGFRFTFVPTAPARVDPATGPASVFPEDNDPRVYLGAWSGDLGLDNGIPQNVYQLNTADLSQLGRKALAPGQEWRLPDGKGTITFDGWREFANFQIAHDPGGLISLVAAIAAITGVTISLLVQRRRIWLRVSPQPDGGTLVEGAGLARSESTGLEDEVRQIIDAATEGDHP